MFFDVSVRRLLDHSVSARVVVFREQAKTTKDLLDKRDLLHSVIKRSLGEQHSDIMKLNGHPTHRYFVVRVYCMDEDQSLGTLLCVCLFIGLCVGESVREGVGQYKISWRSATFCIPSSSNRSASNTSIP